MDKEVKKGKLRISLTIDAEVYAEFKEYCEERGMKMSSKVEQLMRESVKNTTLSRYIA